MCVPAAEVGLEPGLSIDRIEAQLVASAERHHCEERRMAYWLYEIDRRRLFRERGFSSIGDYAMELIGVKPRKARYLVFIASRLESLPGISAAFDAGDLSWTKAREIVRVATRETEGEWLERASKLTNRDLEKAIQRHEGGDPDEFVTFTMSMPRSLLPLWHDCYELAERIYASELEKWQVFEPMMAEFMNTYLAEANEATRESFQTENENDIPPHVRTAVLDRDGWQCAVPGCSMRKMLDPHHIEYRSRGGGHELEISSRFAVFTMTSSTEAYARCRGAWGST